jgi:hypothetical protein
MTGPPAVRPLSTTRSDPANSESVRGLELRTQDGRNHLCDLTAEQVVEAISKGLAEMAQGCHGRYLRALVGAPRKMGRFKGPRTWYGPSFPGVGARAEYAHNEPVCSLFVRGRPSS